MGTLSWPLLLQPDPATTCWDATNVAQTHPVLVVNVTHLLQDSVGTPAQIYIASARLAGIETYEKLYNFDMTCYNAKADFLTALTDHTALKLPVQQYSLDPVNITKVCNKDLFDTLPETGLRNKRHTDFKEAQNKLDNALQISNRLLQL